MNFLSNVRNFFHSVNTSDSSRRITVFHWDLEGLAYCTEKGETRILWAEIERITVYSADCLIYNETCLEILAGTSSLSLPESTIDYSAFLRVLKEQFPTIRQEVAWEPSHSITLYERFDRVMPTYHNFYAVLTNIPKPRIKEIIEQHGWLCRHSGKTELEFRNTWSEFTLQEDKTDFLLNGMVVFHPNTVATFHQILEECGGNIHYEFYDENGDCILEYTNKGI